MELFFLIAVSMAFIGSLAAGLWDLKTTDIPDEITALMAALGIFIWYVYSLATGNFVILAASIATGIALLSFGWFLYKIGQWGGGDATLLAAIGCLVPVFPGSPIYGYSSFALAFALNLFLAGAAYNILYSLAYGIIRQFGIFSKKANVIGLVLNEAKNPIYMISSSAFVVLWAALVLLNIPGPFVFLSVAALFLSLFMPYAKVLEKNLFRKTVSRNELREGDVLLESKIWIGLTKSQISQMNKTNKKYTIKTGVPFGMAFPIALVITYLFGNLAFILANWIALGMI